MMAILPPINEVDLKLHQELLTVMENRVSIEYDCLHEVLPCILQLKSLVYLKLFLM